LILSCNPPCSDHAQIYRTIEGIATSFNLDFDDAYQFCLGKEYNLEIATQDKDFNRVKPKIKIKFIGMPRLRPRLVEIN